MKTVYFVRHGESEGNAGPLRQGPDSSLTEKGREQAQFMAERAKKLTIDVLITSSMNRAVETADMIGKAIDKVPEQSDLFVERRRPTQFVGLPKDHPDAIKAEEEIVKNFTKPGYRHSDEENFDDLKERSGKALEFLEKRKEDHILVVTHGVILKVIVARAIFKESLSARECDYFIGTFRTENTGLTILKYDEKEEYSWWLRTWNDHAHLG